MNESKINLPSNFILNFYYWYSYFTLALTLSITPILFYIILTQSKNLKSFKWLILNHSIWCLILEFWYALIKPIYLTPAFCGFPLGLLKNGTFRTTSIATIIGIGLKTNCVVTLSITLLSRYLLAFPSRANKFLNVKSVSWFCSILMVIVWICGSLIMIPILSLDEEMLHQSALEYDSMVFQKLTVPSSFLFVPYNILKIPLLIIFIIISLFYVLSISFLAFFIFSVMSHQSATITKLQRSLIISSIAQLGLTAIFLVFPMFFLVISIYFQFENSVNILQILLLLLVSHTFVEFLATLYFVSPYRNFVNRWIRQNFVKKHFSTSVVIVVSHQQ